MELSADIEIFARLVASGNKAAACTDMGVLSDDIAKYIARLEEKYGMLLVRDEGGKIILTKEGQELYERIIDIVEKAEDKRPD